MVDAKISYQPVGDYFALPPHPSSEEIQEKKDDEKSESDAISSTASTSPTERTDLKSEEVQPAVPKFTKSSHTASKESVKQKSIHSLSGPAVYKKKISIYKKKSEERFKVSNCTLITVYTVTILSTAFAFVIGIILGLNVLWYNYYVNFNMNSDPSLFIDFEINLQTQNFSYLIKFKMKKIKMHFIWDNSVNLSLKFSENILLGYLYICFCISVIFSISSYNYFCVLMNLNQ